MVKIVLFSQQYCILLWVITQIFTQNVPSNNSLNTKFMIDGSLWWNDNFWKVTFKSYLYIPQRCATNWATIDQIFDNPELYSKAFFSKKLMRRVRIYFLNFCHVFLILRVCHFSWHCHLLPFVCRSTFRTIVF